MTVQLIGSILYFILTVYALLFSLAKTSRAEGESFPNRGRYFLGLFLWFFSSILAIFMSFPGYSEWFVPAVYPVLSALIFILFLGGFFTLLTTVVAFPVYMNTQKEEIDGRTDRVALLENIRQITAQPYPLTESFALVLRELASFLVIPKAAVFLVNPSRREMYLVAQTGLDKQEMTRLERFPLGQDMISRSAVEQSPYLSGDLFKSDPVTRKLILANREATFSAAALPMNSRDRALGTLLTISDKPYRFEKRDRMILAAAAEALAGVVEANRLNRENLKLKNGLEQAQTRLDKFSQLLDRRTRKSDPREALVNICRHFTESYQATGVHIIGLMSGHLQYIASYPDQTDSDKQSESYRAALIDAILGNKMVILNQEARQSDGPVQVVRSTLLAPLPQEGGSSEYALLIEVPGGRLRVTDTMVTDIDMVSTLAGIYLAVKKYREEGKIRNRGVQALLEILKLRADLTPDIYFNKLLDQMENIIPSGGTLLLFEKNQNSEYRLFRAPDIIGGESVEGTVFGIGEGPVGQCAASGAILQLDNRQRISSAWGKLETTNRDFPDRLQGDKGSPAYQLFVPLRAVDETVAVVALFCFGRNGRITEEAKGFLLLATQLFSLRLSIKHLDYDLLEKAPFDPGQGGRSVLNRINNHLATILGRAQLLSHQPDNPERTKYTSGEIVKAAEAAGESIKRLQANLSQTEQTRSAGGAGGVLQRVGDYLQQRRVTGDLYMFENNRPVMVHNNFGNLPGTDIRDDKLTDFLLGLMDTFIGLLAENEELMLRSEKSGGYLYISLIRGRRERFERFDPARFDYGAPDVMPPQIADREEIDTVSRNKGLVSFDRFGRQPTYLTLKLPLSESSPRPQQVQVRVARKAGPRILAIDDQQMILDLLSGIGESLGIRLTAVVDPVQGIRLFKREKYDIVMVDLAMGSASGWDVAREIKELSPQTPIILMTGWGLDLNPDQTAAKGIDFTLQKPFKIEQLSEVIEKARQFINSSR